MPVSQNWGFYSTHRPIVAGPLCSIYITHFVIIFFQSHCLRTISFGFSLQFPFFRYILARIDLDLFFYFWQREQLHSGPEGAESPHIWGLCCPTPDVDSILVTPPYEGSLRLNPSDLRHILFNFDNFENLALFLVPYYSFLWFFLQFK